MTKNTQAGDTDLTTAFRIDAQEPLIERLPVSAMLAPLLLTFCCFCVELCIPVQLEYRRGLWCNSKIRGKKKRGLWRALSHLIHFDEKHAHPLLFLTCSARAKQNQISLCPLSILIG